MGSSRSILLVKLLPPEEEGGDAARDRDDDTVDIDADEAAAMTASAAMNQIMLGTRREVADYLSKFNTKPDGSPLSPGVLYGPGIVAQLPMVGENDPVMQVLVSINEEVAWPVLLRMCDALGWTLMDPSTGRTFG